MSIIKCINKDCIHKQICESYLTKSSVRVDSKIFCAKDSKCENFSLDNTDKEFLPTTIQTIS